ncbi:MAG: alkaline phosphatase family protein [Proteobacteria bacterium]|nr:alkaline phosphatase family protein [Pseudomonadota bacterium]MDA1024042.1 alkaline phosphatase family protein [Pseudomonadota bacterium]
MKRAVVVICDGLRADMVTPDTTPNIWALGEGGTVFTDHKSVFPSTTRTTSASLATGCFPGRHGLEGNCVAIDEGDGLVALNVGHAEFRDRLRKATGRTLMVPTLAERLKDEGGSIVFSNVSAGAAYFQDPDGYGHMYHRQGSFGPGLKPLADGEGLDVSHDADGDRAMSERFCSEVLAQRRPALALLWQCEPDHTQHAIPLGSPEHLNVIAKADDNVGRIVQSVRETANGDDILLIIASDHGHETVGRAIALDAKLIDAGLKGGPESRDVVVASNGFSAHIYVSDKARNRIADIVRLLEDMDGVDKVYAGNDLEKVGHRTDTPLAITVTAERSDDANEFGIRGINTAFEDPLSDDTTLGGGQHGGLGRYEQNAFLTLCGRGFKPGAKYDKETSAVDIAPTILKHLGLPFDGMDGRPLS